MVMHLGCCCVHTICSLLQLLSCAPMPLSFDLAKVEDVPL